jgi:hypothetical protein
MGVSAMIFLLLGIWLIGLHYWKRKGSDSVLILAGGLLAIGLMEVTPAPFGQAMQLAYNGFMELGLGYFMLIVGTVTIAMIWVFDRW